MIWTELNSFDQIQEKLDTPNTTFAIFKHSTRCSVSFMAMKAMNHNWPASAASTTLFHLDLIKHRGLSNEIAESFGIQHESPQLIIVQNGQVVHHASHGAIQGGEISRWL